MSKALEMKFKSDADKVEEMEFEPIQGYPMLHWRGKRPYRSTRYYPAQLKETYGQAVNGPDSKPWLNRIYWGDNREVMSHLLREFRGKVDLVYIDPPFDSKAEYKKTINLRGKIAASDHSAFEEKQYTDIWTNDEYLQFMYERLILIRELLSESGSIYVHCDWHKGHYLRCLLDEIFGTGSFCNEIIWHYADYMQGNATSSLPKKHDNIFFYSKTSNRCFERPKIALEVPVKRNKVIWNSQTKSLEVARDNDGKIIYDEFSDKYLDSVWEENVLNIGQTSVTRKTSSENLGYPTQKPSKILELIIGASSNTGDLVFDCFMGSGTTLAVAMKMGRRFIGADINGGAIHTTTKRLNHIIHDEASNNNKLLKDVIDKYIGFQVFHVNNYEIFKNPVEAKTLLVEALELEPYPQGHLYSGQKDGRQYKIMPVDHITSKADLNELVAGFDQRLFAKLQAEAPNKPVEKITLVCMGHEPDLAAHLKNQIAYLLDVQVLDILRDRQDLEFKRDSVAKVKIEKGELVIDKFYPQNLLQKLSLPEMDIEDWRQLVETVAIDWNYTGEVMYPAVFDSPGKNELVQGRYRIPGDAGRIRLKITDLISESLEMDVDNGQD